MDPNFAKFILEETRRDYNLIAEDFSKSRQEIWPELKIFRSYIQDGDKIIDLGCGNGRLLDLFENINIDYVGVDNSEKLIEKAKNKIKNKVKFMVADGFSLPFPDEYFDKIFSIAVLHHIPSKELRAEFLKESFRVLKKDGLAIFTVWNLWQRKILPKQIKYFLLKIFGFSKLDFGDIFVPFNRKIKRYYHCFTKKELKNIFSQNGFEVKEVGLLKRKQGHPNYYIIAKKQILR